MHRQVCLRIRLHDTEEGVQVACTRQYVVQSALSGRRQVRCHADVASACHCYCSLAQWIDCWVMNEGAALMPVLALQCCTLSQV